MHPGHLQKRVMMFAACKFHQHVNAIVLQAIRDFLCKATGTDTCWTVKNTAAAAVLWHQL